MSGLAGAEATWTRERNRKRSVEARVHFLVYRDLDLKLRLPVFRHKKQYLSAFSREGKKQLPLHVPAIHIQQLQPSGASILFCTGKPPSHRNLPHKKTSGNRELWPKKRNARDSFFPTLTYQNLLFCTVPINSILGFVIRTYRKVGFGRLR